MTDVRSVGMYSIPRHIKLVKLNYGAYIIYMHSSILMQVRTIRQASDNESQVECMVQYRKPLCSYYDSIVLSQFFF